MTSYHHAASEAFEGVWKLTAIDEKGYPYRDTYVEAKDIIGLSVLRR
jgi:hypothetical protein